MEIAVAGRDRCCESRRVARWVVGRAEPGDDTLEVQPRIPPAADGKVQHAASIEQEAADRR
jgi:hypothetical protein